MSIGDVLNLLKEEFPDITISKIRFLESQGLIDPERTASGYRKFYEEDVRRLRWILQQQKENFLPLKVIKDRLDDGAEPLFGSERDREENAAPAVEAATDPSVEAALSELAAAGLPNAQAGSESLLGAPEPPPSRRSPNQEASGGGIGSDRAASKALARARRAVAKEGNAYTATELATAAGLEEQFVEELREFGLLQGEAVLGSVFYDDDDLEVAKLAASFARYGFGPRHLRAYRNAVDREASLFEQVVLPLLRQRNPEARQTAVALLGELAELGGRLREVLLRQALGELR
jgi:DNA-binding transcriptional MerR regulator